MAERIPVLKRGAMKPLGEQLADWLRVRILAGDFEPEVDPLPSEMQLIEMFGVSRPTVRRAMVILRAEGLAVTVRHRGSFVPRDAPHLKRRRRANGGNGPPKSSRAYNRLALADGGARCCQHVWATRPLSRFMFNDIPYAGMHPRTGARQEFM